MTTSVLGRIVDDLGDDLREGHEPFGDGDPGVCHANPVSCSVFPHELDAPPHRCHVPIIEEAYEVMVMSPQVLVPDPADGLPIPANEPTSLDEAPPLTYDNFVCVGDDREYVELFEGEEDTEAYARIGRRVVRRARHDKRGTERERKTFSPGRVEKRFGLLIGALSSEDYESGGYTGGWRRVFSSAPEVFVAVRPKRVRCKHLVAQIMNVDGVPQGEPGHYAVFRNCTVRRSVGGALMDLRDQAVYACELRDPPDPVSAQKHIYDPEKKKLRTLPSREPMFIKDGPALDGAILPEPSAKA